jgi:hypothetical protein
MARLEMQRGDAVPSPDEYMTVAEGPHVDGYAACLAALLLGDRRALAQRVGDLSVTLTRAEREMASYFIKNYRPAPQKVGHPAKSTDARLGVASLYILLTAWTQLGHKEALAETARYFGLSESAIEKDLTFARGHDGGQWWPRVCELAAKHKPWPELIGQ